MFKSIKKMALVAAIATTFSFNITAETTETVKDGKSIVTTVTDDSGNTISEKTSNYTGKDDNGARIYSDVEVDGEGNELSSGTTKVTEINSTDGKAGKKTEFKKIESTQNNADGTTTETTTEINKNTIIATGESITLEDSTIVKKDINGNEVSTEKTNIVATKDADGNLTVTTTKTAPDGTVTETVTNPTETTNGNTVVKVYVINHSDGSQTIITETTTTEGKKVITTIARKTTPATQYERPSKNPEVKSPADDARTPAPDQAHTDKANNPVEPTPVPPVDPPVDPPVYRGQ